MEPVDVHGAKILIVDDQKENLELLEVMLREDGYSRIHATENPAEVLDLHRKYNFDLILLDLEFPDMDGFQVMRELKTNIEDPYLSVIVLTAHSERKLEALTAGAKDFVSKPFDIIELLTRIRNVLEVRLLYMRVEEEARELEARVEDRTAELRMSESRYRGFTDLVSDWYWEQDTAGNFTKVNGPVPEILGIKVDSMEGPTNKLLGTGWNATEQATLRAMVAARESFLDFEFVRTKPDGSQQTFLVSGQPMFDSTFQFIGYRGIGVDISVITKHKHVD